MHLKIISICASEDYRDLMYLFVNKIKIQSWQNSQLLKKLFGACKILKANIEFCQVISSWSTFKIITDAIFCQFLQNDGL